MTLELSPQDATSTVFEASIEGVMNIMKKHCVRQGEKPIPAVRVAGQQGMRELARRFNGKPELPFFTFMIESIQKDRESYPGRNVKRRGMMVETNDQEGFYYKIFLKPVVVNLTVRFFCQSDKDVNFFIQNWMYKDELLIFDLLLGNCPVSISTTIDDSLQIPEVDTVINDIGELFQFETLLSVRTYVGTVQKFKTITRAKVFTNLPTFDDSDVIVVGEETFIKPGTEDSP